MVCSMGSFHSPQDSPLLTCAKLHVHEIIKDNGEAPRHKWVNDALPLQMLESKEVRESAQRARPNSLLPRALTVPTTTFHLQA